MCLWSHCCFLIYIFLFFRCGPLKSRPEKLCEPAQVSMGKYLSFSFSVLSFLSFLLSLAFSSAVLSFLFPISFFSSFRLQDYVATFRRYSVFIRQNLEPLFVFLWACLCFISFFYLSLYSFALISFWFSLF